MNFNVKATYVFICTTVTTA